MRNLTITAIASEPQADGRTRVTETHRDAGTGETVRVSYLESGGGNRAAIAAQRRAEINANDAADRGERDARIARRDRSEALAAAAEAVKLAIGKPAKDAAIAALVTASEQ